MPEPVNSNQVLLWATNLGEQSVVELTVLKYQADQNLATQPALLANRKKIFKWLIEKAGAHGTEALMDLAAQNPDKDYVKTMYIGGTNILEKNLLAASSGGVYETLKYILSVKPGYTTYNDSEAYIAAVNLMTNDNIYLKIVYEFLKTPGLNTGARGEKCLQRAIEDLGNLDLCKELKKRGADLHYNSNLPLQWAQRSGRTEIVKWITGVYQKEYKK